MIKELLKEMVARAYGSIRDLDIKGVNTLLARNLVFEVMFQGLTSCVEDAIKHQQKSITALMRKRTAFPTSVPSTNITEINNIAWLKNLRKIYFNTKKAINNECLGYLYVHIPYKTASIRILKEFLACDHYALEKAIFSLAIFVKMMELVGKEELEGVFDNLIDTIADEQNRFTGPLLAAIDSRVMMILRKKMNFKNLVLERPKMEEEETKKQAEENKEQVEEEFKERVLPDNTTIKVEEGFEDEEEKIGRIELLDDYTMCNETYVIKGEKATLEEFGLDDSSGSQIEGVAHKEIKDPDEGMNLQKESKTCDPQASEVKLLKVLGIDDEPVQNLDQTTIGGINYNMIKLGKKEWNIEGPVGEGSVYPEKTQEPPPEIDKIVDKLDKLLKEQEIIKEVTMVEDEILDDVEEEDEIEISPEELSFSNPLLDDEQECNNAHDDLTCLDNTLCD